LGWPKKREPMHSKKAKRVRRFKVVVGLLKGKKGRGIRMFKGCGHVGERSVQKIAPLPGL